MRLVHNSALPWETHLNDHNQSSLQLGATITSNGLPKSMN